MICRISSMYDHTREIKVVLLVGFVLHISSETILGVLLTHPSTPEIRASSHLPLPIGISLKSIRFSHLYSVTDLAAPSSLKFCFLGPAGWAWALWISHILFELLLFIMAVRIGIRDYHAMKVVQKLRRDMPGGGGSSLMYVLLRDSILFPFVCVSSFALIKFEWLIYTLSATLVAALCLGMQIQFPVGSTSYCHCDHNLHHHIGCALPSVSEYHRIFSVHPRSTPHFEPEGDILSFRDTRFP